ncbi:MAG: arsenate reductase ArsC [Hyphomonadaceae bacterium]|nr:arsenate reductase ArsC [Hyphomonadaceae bacterium]
MTINVLFLCTGNSARSILGEAILSRAAGFRGFSAGSMPKGQVNPYALRLLSGLDYDVSGLQSKSWDVFAQAGAPVMDVIITVCDSAAGEVCPIWPGHPASAHWGQPDPAAATGDDRAVMAAFIEAYLILKDRIDAFLALPVAQMESSVLKERLAEIGKRP